MKPSQSPHPESGLAHQLASRATIILDVRAPVEYAKAHLPHSINLPILDDAQRQQVGTCYRLHGSEQAHALGHKLVSGDIREQRIAAWQAAIHTAMDAGREVAIMCWRGGSRSSIAQQWLAASGVQIPRIPGGYKAVRQDCLALLEAACERSWWIVGGKTGVGKTIAIQALEHSIDLEAIAQHRGSAFGSYPTGSDAPAPQQPPQAVFENTLSYTFARHSSAHIVVEDESRMIGRTALPEAWHARMQTAPVVLVEADLAYRSRHICAEYVDEPLAAGTNPDALQQHLRHCLKRISKRLGGVNHTRIDNELQAAFSGSDAHEVWIASLLRDYYDPMYEYQLQKKTARIRYRGDRSGAIEFLTAKTQS